MTTSRRFVPALVFALALPAAALPGRAAGNPPAEAPGAPATVAPSSAAAAAPRPFIRKLRVRVWEPGAVAPNVSVNVPTLLITVLVKTASVTGILDRALDEIRVHGDAQGGAACPLRLRGHQVDALWSALTGSGPASLVEVRDGDGGRVEIRVD